MAVLPRFIAPLLIMAFGLDSALMGLGESDRIV